MVLKRKRSDSEMSTSSSMFSSPPRFNFHTVEMASPSSSNSQFEIKTTSSHLSSRTRKRYRDNRPSEETVHQSTLSMLLNAQKNCSPSPIPSREHTAPINNVNSPAPVQSSLHSFWTIPSRPSGYGPSNTSISPPPTPRVFQASKCEDCDASFASPDGDSMDVDMDIDVFANGMDHACSACGKQVCHQCAVSNLGAQRRCLMCAGKKTWIGGLGWIIE